mmetsp:Transcript_29103/g.68840  ORF Transcript_29103/g.68840 Transcript_29103/m.68840 type:complete len:739 (+) Transcript_29103:45-2261(+)
MRRWGRALRTPGNATIDLSHVNATIDLSNVADLEATVDLPCGEAPPAAPVICVDHSEGGVIRLDASIGTYQDAQEEGATSGTAVATSGSIIPIHPHVSKAFHAKLRAGLKKSSVLARDLYRPRQATPVISTTCCNVPGQGAGATLVWLRPFDLRLHDHPALWYASRRRCPVQVVFVWSDPEDAALGEWRLAGTAAAFWLHHAIRSLDVLLRQRYGIGVVIRTGDTVAGALLAAAQESGADEVVTSSAFEPAGQAGCAADAAAKRALEGAGIKFCGFNSFLLHDVRAVRVDMGTYRGHFGTLTPFHHACMAQPPVQRPTPEPPTLIPSTSALADEGLDSLGFARMPVRSDGSVLDWGAPILAEWDISEEAALARLRQFLARGGGIGRYEKGRQLADASAVTKISPYLRFGMLSSRLMFHEMKSAGAKEQSIVYWRRLVWRDLAYWQLGLFPQMQNQPIRAHYSGQVWSQDWSALERWQRGMTGFPLVDAGMRELWSTGWMAQNVRMVAAILLCEHLNIHWVEGERWFHHTLVDADSAINAMMWQNAGKSGLDQWNFSMSPASSGKTQDPQGHYVRRWCPELAKLPIKFLHTPWDAPEHVLREAGVVIGPGGTYPERVVVDLPLAARISKDAICNQRKRSLEWSNDQGYDLIVLPRGSTLAHDGQKFRVFTVPKYRNVSEGSAYDEAWEAQQAPAKGRRKGRGKGGGRGSGLSAPGKEEHAGGKASQQSVLYEYMRASGG